MNTYAVINKKNVREQSSSGGVFSVLAEQFEVIYGVAMTENCYGAEVIRVEGEIAPLRGSKYVQAKVGEALKLVKEDLMVGRNVLFSGTGCQVNGLQCFLEKEYENLTCVDVICHGVPSPKLWREYAKYWEGKYGKIENVSFRCKDVSWKDFGMKVNQTYLSKETDPFMRMFLRDYCLRPACYECHAKAYKRADLTIADFWGIEKVAPEMDDGKGTSLVITRTEKGQKLFDTIKEELKWKKVSYEEGVRENPSEYRSVERPLQRDTFFIDLGKLSFEELEKKYLLNIKPSFSMRMVRKVKRIVKRYYSGGIFKCTEQKISSRRTGETKTVPNIFFHKENCCGCTACYAICPKGAIQMEEDEEGFEYPHIDEEKCVGCYMCMKVCPINAANKLEMSEEEFPELSDVNN